MPFIRNETPAPFTPQEVWVSPELKARIEAMPRIVIDDPDEDTAPREAVMSFAKYAYMPDPPSTGNIIHPFNVPLGVFYNPLMANLCLP